MNLVINIRQPMEASKQVGALVRAVCPYLQTFGCDAKLASERSFGDIRKGAHSMDATLLEVQVDGKADPESLGLLEKLERFLKQAAKDTHLAATFELFVEFENR